MKDRILLVFAVIGALIGVVYLVGGESLLPGGGSGGGGDDADRGGALRGLDDGEGAADGKAAEAGDAPMLFGRARAQRKGVGSLQGRVMDFGSGEPVAEAHLTLVGTGYGGEEVTLRASTDAEGRFAYPAVAAGDAYVLKVSDEAGRSRTLPSRSVDHEALTDVGTVWLGKKGTLRGRVVDVEGAPIARADVQVHAGGASMAELLTNMSKLFEQLDKDAEPIARAETDTRGVFEIPAVAPGPLTLVVRAAGHRLAFQGAVMAEEGAVGGEVVVRLETAQPLAGIVVDGNDRPIPRARVACLAQSSMESVFFGRQFSETGPDGRFVIPSPPAAGRVSLIVAAEGFPRMIKNVDGEGEQRLVLVAGAEVRLRFVFAADRRPVEGASVTTMFAGDAGFGEDMAFATATTDAAGEARVLARPGTLQMLWFSHPEHGTAIHAPGMSRMMGGAKQGMLRGPEDLTIGTKDVRFDFELGTGITIRGRVTDDEGRPVPGARVAAMGAMGMGGGTQTDADGRYELRGQGPPIRMILVTKPGYVTKDDNAGMLSLGGMKNEDFEHDVTLMRAASVAGRVLLPDGSPAAGARVRAALEDAGFDMGALIGGRRETVANAQGRYVLDGVAPGKKVHVLVRHAGYLDAKSETFTVDAAGATRAPEVTLRRGAILAVKVLRPDGSPTRGAEVSVAAPAGGVDWDPFDSARGANTKRTDAGGDARFEDIRAGEATVTATREGFAAGRAKVELPEVTGASETVRVTVRLRPGVAIRGRVLDPDGEPVVGAHLSIQAPEDTFEDDESWVAPGFATSDEDGRFAFEDMPGVRMRLSVRADGFQAHQEEVTPGVGELTFRLARMDPGQQARIEAIDAELQELYGQIGQATDDKSRQALFQRLQALQQEKAELAGGG